MRLLEAVAAPGVAACVRGWLLRALGLGRGRTRFARAIAIVLIVAVTVAAVIATIVVPVALTALVAAERPILPMALVPVPVVARLLVSVGLWRKRLRETVVERALITVVVAEFVGAFAHLAGAARALAIAVHSIGRLIELFAIGHDDAAIVLGVLQIILRQHGIAGCLRVTRESNIFFGDVCRSAPDLHIRAIGFEASRKRVVVAFTIVVPATPAAILLSLPHCPLGSRLT